MEKSIKNFIITEEKLIHQKLVPSNHISDSAGFVGNGSFQLSNRGVLKNGQFFGNRTRNAPTKINKINYSGHAIDQMQNRGLVPSVVENAIKTGEVFPTRNGTIGYYDRVNNIKVIMNPETRQVITAIPGTP